MTFVVNQGVGERAGVAPTFMPPGSHSNILLPSLNPSCPPSSLNPSCPPSSLNPSCHPSSLNPSCPPVSDVERRMLLEELARLEDSHTVEDLERCELRSWCGGVQSPSNYDPTPCR